MLPSSLFVLLAPLIGLALAAAPPAGWNQWPSSSSRCYTKVGPSSVPWAQSTSWSTLYTPCSSTTTVVKTVTSTPPSSTTTVTTISTTTSTAPTSSSTSIVTSTVSTSTITTSTSVTTSISTTVISNTATSTVPTSSGFVPIQTSLPGADCDGNCGTDPIVKRNRRSTPPTFGNSYGSSNTSPNYGFSNSAPSWYNQNPAIYGKNKYQQGVTCYQYQASTCSISTVTSTTTVTGTTGTVTSTSTSVSTVTVVPSATVTVTSLTTTTSTSTTVTTSTATSVSSSTTIVSTTTIYAACATNNLADQVNGINIQSLQPLISPDNSGLDITGDPTSAYDCCVAAITDPNVGEVWEFLGNACLIFTNNGAQCSTQDQFIANLDSTKTTYVVAGNAYCGEVTNTAGS